MQDHDPHAGPFAASPPEAMRRFWLRVLLVVVLIIGLDQGLGYVLERLFYQQKTGRYAPLVHVVSSKGDSVIFLGSSHVRNNIIPREVEAELGLPAYNAGAAAAGPRFVQALSRMILQQQRPKMLVINVDLEALRGDDKAREFFDKRLPELYPFLGRFPEAVRPVLPYISKWERFSTLSRLVRFNSLGVQMLWYKVRPNNKEAKMKGYEQLYGKLKSVGRGTKEEKGQLDTVNLNTLIRTISEAQAKGVQVVTVMPPLLRGLDLSGDAMAALKQALARRQVPLLVYTNDPRFTGQPHFYSDYSHLNLEGAKLYSQALGKDLKELVRPGASTPSR